MLFRAIAIAAAAVLLATAIARADTSQSVPPGVARISVIQSGTVVLMRSGKTKTQVAGSVNMPVFAGDYVATTDADTLAELQLDGYTALRLSGGVQLQLVANDAQTREVDLAQGLVELAVLHTNRGVNEVVTPNVVVRASEPGDYRIWVSSDGQTSVTSRRGDLELVTPQHTFDVAAGKTILVRGDSNNPSLEPVDKVANDAFDDFNHNRDRALFADLNENTHVPSDIAAYDDLDKYGHWADVAPYGESWIPNQTSDWAPYRDGTWVWSASYGWTWVGNEPWGWLPYHYGSWFFANGYGWCWYPPSLGIVPVWVPAFVAFFDFSTSPYGYGWVPLAPYETFYPWYPWYWGWYYPWPRGQRSFPAPPFPPAPPPPHHRTPIRMHPIAHPITTKYRNAAFGGASTFASHAAQDGIKAAPIRFDPARFTSVTVRHDPQPVSLPVDRPPVETRHVVPLSPRFNETERTSQSQIPVWDRQMPVAPTAPGAWHESSAPRGGIPAPAMPRAPVGTSPIQPVEQAPIQRAPSAPVVHGSNGNGNAGGNGNGNGSSAGSANGNGSLTVNGGSRPPA